MKALDTNVIARFFVDDPDDPEAAKQRPAAIAAMKQQVFVSTSVILELEWVMRGFYGLPREDIHRALSALCGYANVQIDDRHVVLDALTAYAQGLDFADALHLMHASHCQALLTFDKRLLKRAAALGLLPACEEPNVSP
ncbi:MAG: type II toxin-antitoxin system VapC family toxin [Halothiobacillaceae bacterium]|nr:type II toxin-antitoxin system VapC family toxin [Halothiobacillaceae bacterium]